MTNCHFRTTSQLQHVPADSSFKTSGKYAPVSQMMQPSCSSRRQLYPALTTATLSLQVSLGASSSPWNSSRKLLLDWCSTIPSSRTQLACFATSTGSLSAIASNSRHLPSPTEQLMEQPLLICGHWSGPTPRPDHFARLPQGSCLRLPCKRLMGA